MRARLAAGLAAALLCGCAAPADEEAVACAYGHPLLEARITTPPSDDASGAVLVVRRGERADSARFHAGDHWFAEVSPPEPGIYRVSVRAPGYREWALDSFRIDEACSVPQTVFPRLVPDSAGRDPARSGG